MRLTPDDSARYPARLRELDDPPILHATGLLDAGRTVAIVGSRQPQWASLSLAFELAFGFAKAGFVVVSGATGTPVLIGLVGWGIWHARRTFSQLPNATEIRAAGTVYSENGSSVAPV